MKQQSFLNKISNNVSDTWTQYKILPSLVLAQAILESGWGTSELATKANNLFGIKANSSWTGAKHTVNTSEFNNGQLKKVNADFRKYKSWDESIVDHAKFLKDQSRYQAVIGEKDFVTACRAIQSAGYATDPQYADKLMRIITTNNLDDYDEIATNQKPLEFEFSSTALKANVDAIMRDKPLQRDLIQKASACGAINTVWLDKFDKGTLGKHDIIGLSLMYFRAK